MPNRKYYAPSHDGYIAKGLLEDAIAGGAEIEIAVVQALRARHLNPVQYQHVLEEILDVVREQHLTLKELAKLREEAAKKGE